MSKHFKIGLSNVLFLLFSIVSVILYFIFKKNIFVAITAFFIVSEIIILFVRFSKNTNSDIGYFWIPFLLLTLPLITISLPVSINLISIILIISLIIYIYINIPLSNIELVCNKFEWAIAIIGIIAAIFIYIKFALLEKYDLKNIDDIIDKIFYAPIFVYAFFQFVITILKRKLDKLTKK